jgi:nitroreductase
MEFFDLVHHRYSVRGYKQDLPEVEKVQKILSAAQAAPTAANRQPFRLVVIHTAGKENDLREVYDRDWFVNAPLIICACGISEQAWVRADGRSYLDVDIAIVMDHLSLAAADLGLGTCWVASFDKDAACELLNIPNDAEPIVFMSLGYPADNMGEKERKALKELISYETW